MKTFLIVISVILVLILVSFFVLGVLSKSGDAPGLANQKLSKCSAKPNCVNSEFKIDNKHFIAPIQIPLNSPADLLETLKKSVEEMGGTIQLINENYLAATFTSRVFKFVDDFEIRIDRTQNLLHIRAGSRVGYSDGGVNKHRVESLRKTLTAIQQ